MSNVKKVLIVGGGIGGLSTAIALENAGIKTEIVEIQKEYNVYGVGIILQSNAIRVLDDLGVLEEVVARGKSYEKLQMCSGQGHVFHELPAQAAGKHKINCGISRRELHNILYAEAMKKGVNIRLGLTVDVIQDNEDTVFVEFTDGSIGEYDLVVGCDGVNSKVRNMLFGEQKPQYVGQAVWRYTMKRPKEMPDALIMTFGKKNKAGIVPMSEDTVYVFVVTTEPENEWKPEDQLHVLMKETLDEFGGFIPELRDQIVDPKGVVYRPISTLLMDKPWNSGRTLIIGDAAHATTPHMAMGAAIAIEDAIVLANMLKEDLPMTETLNSFVERRFERCKLVVDTSNTLVKWELLMKEGKLPKECNMNQLIDETTIKMAEAY
ncbi:FAD-dependent monooxygenase [Alkalihalobacillus sp. MEB130]|uniref:FAD-dependent monooxygenase n=1 Tax=Alkalihalobacillus sp. MEB130 TaxID=2976704 RepID=UPI0028DED6D1|nr:FAD-dependent monooxygenase [Alkalihalobacillus sp. MEB130]MDT8860191.1 FAD-dependent monooxygenase [Alkalihalobacillus sp. MEB130]